MGLEAVFARDGEGDTKRELDSEERGNGTREMGAKACLMWVCCAECRTERAARKWGEIQEWFGGSFSGGATGEVECVQAEQVEFDEPPIAIIGTDAKHRREISQGEVARFVNHMRAWRGIFHGGFEMGIVMECGSEVQFKRSVLEEMRDDWEVAVVGNGGEREKLGGIGSGDMGGYILTRDGAERLLSEGRAYVVRVEEFVERVFKEGGVMLWRASGGGTRKGPRCAPRRRAVRASDEFPFHAPRHRWHGVPR